MSSTLLQAEGINHSFGDRTVLAAVDLHLGEEGRIGLVGPNGAGKSTLLRILAGTIRPERGSVRRHAPVGYLPQRVDVESLEVLEAAIDDWPGALVVASHDARLREALQISREFALSGLPGRR